MSLRLRRTLAAGLSAALLVAASGSLRAQAPKEKNRADASKKTDAQDRTSGVIVKVDRIESKKGATTDNADRSRTLRLTINTAAVWLDWVRDQATQSGNSESPKKEAKEGANSVATKGELQDKDTLVVVDLTPETRVETRFRLPEDETSKGAKSPEAARKEAGEPAPPGSGRRDSARPTRFSPSDLKAGLFIEVDYRHTTAQNRASRLTVIRPVPETNTTREK